MSIDALRQMILFDFPETDVRIDISQAKGVHDMNASLTKFLLASEDSGTIGVAINDQDYILPNSMSYDTTKAFHAHMNEVAKNDSVSKFPTSSFSWMKHILSNGASLSTAGTLANFCKAFNLELNKRSSHSLDDIERYTEQSLLMFTSPIRNEMFKTMHLLNDSMAELNHYSKMKESIEAAASEKIRKYIGGVFIASIFHFSAFYYMIFHVDWLGKQIP